MAVIRINNNYNDVSQIIKDYLFYMEIIRGKSKKTSFEYYHDLKTFFKFMKFYKGSDKKKEIDEIDISDIDINFIKTISLSDVYEFLYYAKTDRNNNSTTLSRKISCLRSFFKYLTVKMNLLENNPVEQLDFPTQPKRLPKYLSLDESITLLNSIDGKNKRRDYAILTIFLNCGIRLSELVSLNINDVYDDYVVVTGKGNKQRTIFLNDACRNAIDDYIKHERPKENIKDKNALFISRNKNRISPKTVQWLVKKYFNIAGFGEKNYSVHKLRHTAATLMYRHGKVDLRVLQEILGHESLQTTQIYTHVENEQIKDAALKNPLSKIKNTNKS